MINYCRNCQERIPDKRGNNPVLWCDECRDEVDRELRMGKYEEKNNVVGVMVNRERELMAEIERLKEENYGLSKELESKDKLIELYIQEIERLNK